MLIQEHVALGKIRFCIGFIWKAVPTLQEHSSFSHSLAFKWPIYALYIDFAFVSVTEVYQETEMLVIRFI